MSFLFCLIFIIVGLIAGGTSGAIVLVAAGLFAIAAEINFASNNNEKDKD